MKINIGLWKKAHQQLLCKWVHCLTGQGQVTGVALALRHSLLKVRHDKNRVRCRRQRENRNSNSAAQRVVWTPSNLKNPVWKYFGFWSVDSKNAEPRDKVVCKLCKLQLAYNSTTSNMRVHLKNGHAMMSETPTKQPHQLIFHRPPQALCSMTRGVHEGERERGLWS